VSNLLLKKEKGFTLIEIVLVLAIAGLLLVIVFLAVSGAQKSRRDTQRKNDLSRIASSLESSASNNNGSYPGGAGGQTWAAFWTAYVNNATSNLKDPSTGTVYTQGPQTGTGGNPTLTALGSGATATVAYDISGRTYHVCINLEQGTQFCQNNQ
jgi:prepilin-type N-terminal cleavage/methylation domain-containing protein